MQGPRQAQLSSSLWLIGLSGSHSHTPSTQRCELEQGPWQPQFSALPLLKVGSQVHEKAPPSSSCWQASPAAHAPRHPQLASDAACVGSQQSPLLHRSPSAQIWVL